MTEYQERRAQYLRDAHDWAEDGDLPDASADYEPITVQDIAKIYEVPIDLLETATVQVTIRPRQSGRRALTEEIRTAYQAGRADERTAVVSFLRREAEYGKQGTSAPDLLRVVAACIETGDHHK